MKHNDMCNIPDEILSLLQKDIAEIKVALLGNEYNPSGGLLSRAAILEKDIEKLKSKYEKIMWVVGTVASVFTILFNFAILLWDKVFGL